MAKVKSKKQNCMGLDPSFAGFTMACVSGTEVTALKSVSFEYLGPGLEVRYGRLAEYGGALLMFMHEHQITRATVEGYSFGSKNKSQYLTELGCTARNVLIKELGIDNVTEVPPKSLKKFVAGKGNASKLLMVQRIAKRFGIELNSDDEADAIGLADMCEAVYNDRPLTNKQEREAIRIIQS